MGERQNYPVIWLSGIPEEVARFLREIAETHLEALCANAEARARGQQVHDPVIQGVPYKEVPTSQYRVWCLEQLQTRHRAMPDPDRARLDALLKDNGAFGPLTRLESLRSDYNTSGEAPFGRSLAVYENLV